MMGQMLVKSLVAMVISLCSQYIRTYTLDNIKNVENTEQILLMGKSVLGVAIAMPAYKSADTVCGYNLYFYIYLKGRY